MMQLPNYWSYIGIEQSNDSPTIKFVATEHTGEHHEVDTGVFEDDISSFGCDVEGRAVAFDNKGNVLVTITPTSKTTLTEEARALLKMSEALDQLPDDEARCRTMAIVSTLYGQYDIARGFLDKAQFLRTRPQLP